MRAKLELTIALWKTRTTILIVFVESYYRQRFFCLLVVSGSGQLIAARKASAKKF